MTKKLTRKDVPADANLCEYCTAKCCGYFALPIDQPDDLEEFENIRWYMLHGSVSIFVEDGSWYLTVNNVCDQLQADHRCGIYETRPTICRKYTTDECEFEDDAVYDKFFETPEQMWEYSQAVLKKKKQLHRFSPKPPAAKDVNLPVVTSVV